MFQSTYVNIYMHFTIPFPKNHLWILRVVKNHFIYFVAYYLKL
jgi:hypothetical protein